MGQAFDEITRKSAKEVQIKCNLQKLIFISNFNRNISKSLMFDVIRVSHSYDLRTGKICAEGLQKPSK
jgi:hypothetical protein